MRYWIFILLFLFTIASCQDINRTKKPKDLIPEKKMINVLTEMSLVQGARSYSMQELERRGLKPDEYLWKKFNIDSSQFARSNNYYAENYVIYQRIYEKVKDSLEALKTQYDSIRVKEERERDSLLKITREKKRDSLKEEERQETELDSVIPDTTKYRTVPPKVSRERPIE